MKISHFGHLSWSVLGQESLQGNGLNHRGKINCVGRELVNARRNRKELGRKLTRLCLDLNREPAGVKSGILSFRPFGGVVF